MSVSSAPPARRAAASMLPSLSPHPSARRPATATAPRRAVVRSRLIPTSTTASSSATNFVVFPELPDQLLCAPGNSIWVYGQYALSFFTSESAAQLELEKKLQSMLREAQRHYEMSRAFFFALSPEEQRAEVLRNASTGGCSASHLRRSPSAMAGGVSALATLSLTDAAVVDENVFSALRDAWPSRDDDAQSRQPPRQGGCVEGNSRSEHPLFYANGYHSSKNAWEADNVVTAAAATEGREGCNPPYPPGLRVNLVLDIVASRKTLGATPLRSRAYRIAESLYRRVMRPTAQKTHMEAEQAPAARTPTPGTRPNTSSDGGRGRQGGAHSHEAPADVLRDVAGNVRTFVIGISDTDVTLVGRDVVCPYRNLPGPTPTQLRVRRALEALADQQRPASSSTSVVTPSAALATATRSSTPAEIPLTAVPPVSRQGLQRHSVDALMPSPYTRVAPTLLGTLDQKRLILCAPPVEWSVGGDAQRLA